MSDLVDGDAKLLLLLELSIGFDVLRGEISMAENRTTRRCPRRVSI